ncbi:spore germination protein [Sporosarcina sp. P21c]|uniref:spore germination protein n=1 Tax=Sporosarcina TaxID=1569 RepID=UPI000A156BFD|nr:MULTISPECIES: spore germination protein [Sporosarcina]ARJ38841.1 spore gernimation protein [Sporosarcina ureae]PIC68319.1 spore germination protein [Sporosarcina sp. P16a]PIC88842.1 spore germination protein [Sporosarcina sp. P21c]PIC94061.1 spore germination protein [Sporosarcina sp. P25]
MKSDEKEIDINSMKQLFLKSADVQFQSYTFNERPVVFITCNAMIDQQLLNEVIVQRVQLMMNHLKDVTTEEAIVAQLHIPDLKRVEDINEAGTLVYTGNLLLYFEEFGLLFSSNIAKKPNRNPEETKLEAPVKGPRDNFIEDVSVNIALIRKRLPTSSLSVEKFELGKRTKTTVALLYFDDIASKETLNSIKNQIKKVDMDIVFSPDLLMESMDIKGVLFPRTNYTGRPDNAIQSLARGRFLIFVDGAAYAVILPINLFLLVKTSDDNENIAIYSSLERILRIFGLSIGITLPALWLALTTFHQDQLPLLLLATVVKANTGLPLPTTLEMLLMLLMFELFREAGLRLPIALGGTIGVVGGLIIGDAAIRAGITSPAMIVVIAASTISTFTLVNQSLVGSVSILRIFFIILTSFFGLFGFLMALYFTVLYLASIRTFGVPYMNIATDLSWETIQKSLLRLYPKQYKKRPNMLSPKDKTRNKEGGK